MFCFVLFLCRRVLFNPVRVNIHCWKFTVPCATALSLRGKIQGNVESSQTLRRSARSTRSSVSDSGQAHKSKRRDGLNDDPDAQSRLARGKTRQVRGRGRGRTNNDDDAVESSTPGENNSLPRRTSSVSSSGKSPSQSGSAKKDSAALEANEARRVELLKRLNQIEKQRNELTRVAGASFGKVSIPSYDASPSANQSASNRPSSKRTRSASNVDTRGHAKRQKSDVATDSTAHQSGLGTSPRLSGSRLASAMPTRSQKDIKAPPTPELDLDIAKEAVDFSAGISPGFLRANESKPSSKARSTSKDVKQFMAPSTPPASPSSSRATGRVRTPSVLLTKQPGETISSGGASRENPKNSRLSFCLRIVKDLLRLKDAFAFSKPIDQLWPLDQLPGYFEMIHKPMDLSTVREKLENGAYSKAPLNKHMSEHLVESEFDADEYATDMRLVFDNARTYNRPGDIFYEAAGRLKEKFEHKFALIPTAKDVTVQASKKSKKKKKDSSHKDGNGFRPSGTSRKSDAKRRKAGSASNDGTSTGKDSSPNASRSKNKKVSSAGSGSKAHSSRRGEKEASNSKKDPSQMTSGELQDRMESLQRQLGLSAARSPSPSPTSGGASYLAQAQAMYHLPMTFEDKVRLSENVSRLPGDKLQKLVALVSKNTAATMEVNNDEEIELDIDHMDNKTLRDMEAFVNHTLYRKRGGGGRTGANTTGEFTHLTKEQILAEIERVQEFMRRGNSSSDRSRTNERQIDSVSGNNGSREEKSFYDASDSSSDSDSSDSGSSDSDSSDDDSDEDSETSDDDAKEEERKRLRERNFEHRRQMGHGRAGGGTPLRSPTYGGLQAGAYGMRSTSASPQDGSFLRAQSIDRLRASPGSSNMARSPTDHGSPSSSS